MQFPFVKSGHRAALVVGFSLLSTALAPLAGRAEDGVANQGTFGIYFENDAIADDDHYYTNGVQLGWSSPNLGGDSPWMPLFRLVPFVDQERYQKSLLLSLGHSMFTPDDKDAVLAVPNDRPYAGWLYGGIGVALKSPGVRHTLMLNVGVVGSWAMAEQLEDFIHSFNSNDSNGWDNQLRNELGVIAAYDCTWRWPHDQERSGLGWELLPSAGIAVGNVLTAAKVGAEFRVGVNLPNDFGSGGISPTTVTSTPLEGSYQPGRFGIYAFARAEGRAVAHNIFLDGNTFADSVSVDKEPFVADLSVGVAMTIRSARIAAALVYRTDEFKTQIEPQVFGTLSINWAY